MNNIKVGDKVICIPGFENPHKRGKYGGSGYKEGRTFIVNKIAGTEVCCWEKHNPLGVYINAIKLVNEESNYEIY